MLTLDERHIVCAVCGTVKQVRPVHKRTGRAKYCSIKCTNTARIGKYCGGKSPVWRKPINRFEEKIEMVTESGCWIWMGSAYPSGYGCMELNGSATPTHRISWELYRGEIPAGLFVLHHCDTPACCNPHHLFLGTNQDNMTDMKNKGRGKPAPIVLGEKNPSSKLTAVQIVRIRKDNRSQTTIAKQYGVTQSNVSLIKRGLSWKHLF